MSEKERGERWVLVCLMGAVMEWDRNLAPRMHSMIASLNAGKDVREVLVDLMGDLQRRLTPAAEDWERKLPRRMNDLIIKRGKGEDVEADLHAIKDELGRRGGERDLSAGR